MNVLDGNWVTLGLLGVVAVSMLQGFWRGASGSAQRLFFFLSGSLLSLASVVLAGWAAARLSPVVQSWLASRDWTRPSADGSALRQFGFTLATGLRDLPLLRFAIVFLACYLVLRIALGAIGPLVAGIGTLPLRLLPSGGSVSRTVGGLFGAALGGGRALLLTAVLFGYCSLMPQGPFADYIQQSVLYREMAAQIIRPAAGKLFEERLPVFARNMQSELDQLWQKRYDVIDANLPKDIVAAAQQITKGQTTDEGKARALYDWVGSRIAYDNDKVAAYEQRGEWREQTPEDTYRTRKGVCIDYARLYAAMARSVGLNVRVVTGLGYDGQGGYGPHAWNEVFLSEQNRWVPLDTTWAKTGNWFDPPKFQDTHIRTV